MVINFPLRNRSETQEDPAYETMLAAIRPFADDREALCQLLANCLVRLKQLEREPTAPA